MAKAARQVPLGSSRAASRIYSFVPVACLKSSHLSISHHVCPSVLVSISIILLSHAFSHRPTTRPAEILGRTSQYCPPTRLTSAGNHPSRTAIRASLVVGYCGSRKVNISASRLWPFPSALLMQMRMRRAIIVAGGTERSTEEPPSMNILPLVGSYISSHLPSACQAWLDGPMDVNGKRVLVALSGGVDSAVTAAL